MTHASLCLSNNIVNYFSSYYIPTSRIPESEHPEASADDEENVKKAVEEGEISE